MLDPKMVRQIALYGVVGTEVAASVVLGVVGGYYLDHYLKTQPLFIILGCFLGCGTAIWRLCLLVRRLNKEDGND